MSHWKVAPDPKLTRFVACIAFSNDPDTPRTTAPIRVVPDGCIDLLFSLPMGRRPGQEDVRAEVFGAKTRALLHGRLYVSIEDVKKVALPVLRHRVLTTYGAEAEGYTSDRLIQELLDLIPERESENLSDDRLPNVLGS